MFKRALSEIATCEIIQDEPMKKHTSLGVGGPADYYVEVDSLYALNSIVQAAKTHRIKYKILGYGTNVLVSDEGFRGLVISTKKLSDVFFKRDYVRAMAGASINKLMRFNLENKLTGIEALAGLPATVGGAIAMNASAFGRSISDNIVEVETLKDGKIIKYFKSDCKFSYRKSRFLTSKEIIVSATFDFQTAARELIISKEKAYLDLRRKNQPIGKTCGSVFKNPEGYYAGELIDKANLKGYTIGGAKVSELHANFIVTQGSARAADVYNLILHIKQKINDVFGIFLQEEVEYLGEF